MGLNRKKVLPTIAGLLVVLLSLAWQQTTLPIPHEIRQRVESVIFDIRMNLDLALSEKRSIDDRIVIVTIDEKSLNEQGHWPWPRNQLADMVNQLFEGGAIVIGFDIMFPEKQLNSVEHVLEAIPTEQQNTRSALNDVLSQFDHDRTLASSFENGDVVLGYAFHDNASQSPNSLATPSVETEHQQLPHIVSMTSYSANIPLLQNAAMGAGFVTTIPDADGILRRTPMVMSYDEK